MFESNESGDPPCTILNLFFVSQNETFKIKKNEAVSFIYVFSQLKRGKTNKTKTTSRMDRLSAHVTQLASQDQGIPMVALVPSHCSRWKISPEQNVVPQPQPQGQDPCQAKGLWF